MSEIAGNDLTTQPATPGTEPMPTLSLAEHVRKIIAEAPTAIPFAKVKSTLKAAGVKVGGKAGVSDADIQRELEAEGIHIHPAPKPDGKSKFWHSKHVTAEEKAAAKVAEIERKKAEKAAAAESKKAEAATEKARLAAEKQALAQKKKDDALAEKARIATEKAAAAQKKKDDALAEKARIATEKEAEKAKAETEAAQKRIAAIGDSVRAKVETLGSKVVSPEQLYKFTAKHGDAEKTEFERVLKQHVEDKKLYEHPGGKYGLSAPLSWLEKFKTPFDALVKAAQKLTANDVPLDEVIAKLREKIGTPSVKEETKVVSPAAFDLTDFAKRVLAIAKHTPEADRFHGNKAFISAVWHASQRDPHFPKLSLHEFKDRLVKANSESLLQLVRADEVHSMNQSLVGESETRFLTATFHFILL